MAAHPPYGKGSVRRPEDRKKVRENWDEIDWSKKREPKRAKSKLP